MELREIKNKLIWERFFAGQKEKTFLNSWNWGEFSEEMGNKIWRLGVFDGENLLALALALKIKAKRGTFILIQHGPAIKVLNRKKEVFKIILEELKVIASKEGADFLRINPLWLDTKENRDLLKEFSFKNSPMHASAYEGTLKLDITLPEERLFADFRKTTRYLVRQGLGNKDVSVETSSDLKDAKLYQGINKEISKRQKFVPFSFEFIKKEFEVLSKDNKALWFFGKYKGETVAAALVVFWSDIAFYHQAGSKAEHSKLSLPYLIMWEAIKEAKRRGCDLFDFWGHVDPEKNPKHPWAGPTLFKMGFGGQAFQYLKTQDLPISWKYPLIYAFEKLRSFKRGL
ncbi:MAG: peptidoglycan bridge formation glycyltransferase FemA/FemB family protein [Candidatus Nealsonbacteria bacterium]